MSFNKFKKGFLKTFVFFFAVASCLGLVSRAQAGTNEARTYFQIHMPELVMAPSGYFQCLRNGSLNRMLIVDLAVGFEKILTEFDNGTDGNTLSSDWATTVLGIISNYSCLLNSSNPSQDLNRVGNMALFMLMARGPSAPSAKADLQGARTCYDPTNDACVSPFQLSSPSLDFGNVMMISNTFRIPQVLTLTNESNITLSFTFTGTTNSDFNVDTQQTTCNAATPLTQGQSCSVYVFFNPSKTVLSSDSLTVAFVDNNAKTYSVIVPLTGTGVAPTKCGNGIVESGEECDDGNQTDGDGCSATCTKEAVLNPSQTPTPTPTPTSDPSAAAGGGCSMGAATSAQATSLLSLLPFSLVAFARVYRKK